MRKRYFHSLKIQLKETRNSFKKWSLNLWWIIKAATFESFLYLSCRNTQLHFFVRVLFNIFMRKTLTNDFWRLHKIMKCVFPLRKQHFIFLLLLVRFAWLLSWIKNSVTPCCKQLCFPDRIISQIFSCYC